MYFIWSTKKFEHTLTDAIMHQVKNIDPSYTVIVVKSTSPALYMGNALKFFENVSKTRKIKALFRYEPQKF